MFGHLIPDDKRELLAKWVAEQDAAFAAKQVHPKGLEHLPKPYYGACGGSLTYSFTPTTLGVVVKVTHNGTQQTIDLTDYAW